MIIRIRDIGKLHDDLSFHFSILKNFQMRKMLT